MRESGQRLHHEEVWQHPRLELAQHLLHDVTQVPIARGNQYIASRLLPIRNHFLVRERWTYVSTSDLVVESIHISANSPVQICWGGAGAYSRKHTSCTQTDTGQHSDAQPRGGLGCEENVPPTEPPHFHY